MKSGRKNRNLWKSDRKNKSNKIGYMALLVCVIALAGMICYERQIGPFTQGGLTHLRVNDNRTKEQAQKDFNTLSNEIFKEEVTGDSLTLNYTVRNPEKYGIDSVEPTLGEYTLKEQKNSLFVSENRVATLETYDYDKLNTEQKLIYDIVYYLSKQNMESADFLEYTSCLGPTTGIQVQLPVLFAEYNFSQKEDIATYVTLLNKVPDYFAQILEFEKMKSKKGIFMSDTTAQAIIEQCQKFVKNPSSNYLITIFEKKIKQVNNISDQEEKQWIEKNKEAILHQVIPAYENLIQGLKKLKGSGKNSKGLCYLKKGKAYYAYLVKSKTGSSRSLKEINGLLDETIDRLKKEMAQIMAKTPDVYYDAQDVVYPYKDPKKTMEHLKKIMKKDFLAIEKDITCDVKYVDKSLEDSMSPAFYLTPAIDDYGKNVVYFNGASKYDLTKAFTTIAHESYPGHLYQNCYFNSTDPAAVRSVINVGGYTEGWGTYAELYSYDYAGIDKKVANLLKKNTLATLCIYAKADMAVNYLGWDYKKLQAYLSDFGFSKTAGKAIFDSMVAEPAGYMEYTLGYLEIMDLQKEAKEKLGKNYNEKAFHQFFLKIGPAPFAIIRDRMDDWMASQK